MKELSSNNRLLSINFPILITIIGVLIIVFLLKDETNWLISSLILVLIVGFIFGRRIYYKTENIFYDSEYLYLKGISNTRKVKLNKINSVKLTLTDQKILGIRFRKYNIEFIDGLNNIDSVSFWSGFDNSKLINFEKHLNYYSPKTVIKHSASTFD